MGYPKYIRNSRWWKTRGSRQHNGSPPREGLPPASWFPVRNPARGPPSSIKPPCERIWTKWQHGNPDSDESPRHPPYGLQSQGAIAIVVRLSLRFTRLAPALDSTQHLVEMLPFGWVRMQPAWRASLLLLERTHAVGVSYGGQALSTAALCRARSGEALFACTLQSIKPGPP